MLKFSRLKLVVIYVIHVYALFATVKTDSLVNEKDFKTYLERIAIENAKEIRNRNTTNNDSILTDSIDSQRSDIQITTISQIREIIAKTSIIEVNSLLLKSNPLLINLVLRKPDLIFDWKNNIFKYSFFFPNQAKSFTQNLYKPFIIPSVESIITDLRQKTINQFKTANPNFFAYNQENLPGTEAVKSRKITNKKIEGVQLADNTGFNKNSKLTVQKLIISPWKYKANSMLQFTQNFVSKNWHQGGNHNVAILGILNGQMNYDNKKNIQWENSSEWRAGFNTVEGDTLRLFNTNDDIFKINSKLGIKAGGNWFYSGTVDFSTQLFSNYKAVNSKVMKASFLTPVRLNISAGIDYKYKKLFSLMISPISYKYIYAKDIINVSPNLFGIKAGENVLSQIGSSFRGQFSYSPSREIQIDSKLMFYTNYEKVEVDWEFVGIFAVNRYLSTRFSLNPRYDNTVIMKPDEKVKLQFKELLSFGFSYRLLD